MIASFNKTPEGLPSECRIAVPPGVGDVYWCLAKMKSFREKNNIKKVTMCVQKTELTRALAWPKMTDGLIDDAVEFDFKKTLEMDAIGYSRRIKGVDFAMWPNAVINRGQHLSRWLPRYALDLDFKINTEKPKESHPFLVYASSQGINKNWLPGQGARFWAGILKELTIRTGKLPTLIGAGWDENFETDMFRYATPYISMVGKTTLPQVAGLLENAQLIIGIISGMTILANHFRTPSLAIYPDRFLPGFLSAWIKPGTPLINVRASDVKSASDIVQQGIKLSEHAVILNRSRI